jgi:hypothetical protein
MMEEKKKSSKGKWIIAIVLIAATIIIAGLYLGIFSMPTGLAAGAQTIESTNPPPVQQPIFTTTGTEVIAKEVTAHLPYNESIDMEPGRYALQVITDKPVWIRLYDQIHFDEWKNDGTHGRTVIGTNLNENDKTDNFNMNFNIGSGQGGKYYLLIFGNTEMTSIKFKITQIFKT